MQYGQKVKTVTEALGLIRSNDTIVTGLGAGEARELLMHLHTISDRVKNVRVLTTLPLASAPYFTDPKYQSSFHMESWFYTKPARDGVKHQSVSFIPSHLHLAGVRRIDYERPDVFIGVATPPNKHGYMSLSCSNAYEKRMIEAADRVIIEINPNYPRTFGDLEVHVNDVDVLVPVNYPVPELPDVEPNEKDLKIGQFIAEHIKDGDCLQLGIGGIPNAVSVALKGKKDLGIHTEMMTTGIMKLMKTGVVTNKRKSIHRGKTVTTFAFGTKELYDFIDDNPAVQFLDSHYVNDPYIIGQNDNQVSINTTIEIDLTGQCASESIGTRQFSGTGGQADTAIGAQRSKNGRSFIALYSTANVRNETGEREEISKIVPLLKPGAAVTLSRNDVDHVVTEYGCVRLRGLSIRDRVKQLISIAHPKFREQLTFEAKKLGYLY